VQNVECWPDPLCPTNGLYPMLQRILNWFFKPKVTDPETEVFRAKVLDIKSAFESECQVEKGYFTGTRYRLWLSKSEILLNDYKNLIKGHRPTSNLKASLTTLRELINDSNENRAAFNDAYMASEVKEKNDFFEKGQESPLDADQRLAVVCDEDHTLVLAGAGSGKTSVIAAKAAYLAKIKKIPEEEILLLTFGKKAAEEMQERVRKGRPGWARHALQPQGQELRGENDCRFPFQPGHKV